MIRGELDVAIDVAVGYVGKAGRGTGVDFSADDMMRNRLDTAVAGLLNAKMDGVVTRMDIVFRTPAEKARAAKGDFLLGAVDAAEAGVELFDEIGVAVLKPDKFTNISIDEFLGIFGEDTGGVGEGLSYETGSAGFAAGGEFVLLAGGGLRFAEFGDKVAKMAGVRKVTTGCALMRREGGDLAGRVGFGICPGAAGFFGYGFDTAGANAIKIVDFMLEVFDVAF